MTLSAPVAFLIFNRPELTEAVFDQIAQVKPSKLLVVADGPRLNQFCEVEKCQKTRDVINRVDWDCDVLTNFSEINLGCKQRVASGLDWVFSEVEEAIILEDDCLPSPSFFYYCQILLEKYRDDERIMMISGDNFQSGQRRTEYSYYFSKYAHVWGWASWRRAWKHYDVSMKTWEEYKELNLISAYSDDSYEEAYWTDQFERVFNNEIDTWDYQWVYSCWSQGGLSIIPNTNLISNLGFGADATHTTSNSPLANLPTSDISDIKHPPFVVRHKVADKYTFEQQYGGMGIAENRTFMSRFKQKVRSLNFMAKI